jgi:hypothetical protein
MLLKMAAALQAQGSLYSSESTLKGSIQGPEDVVVIIQRNCSEEFLRHVLRNAQVLFIASQAHIYSVREKIGDLLYHAGGLICLGNATKPNLPTVRHGVSTILNRSGSQQAGNACHWGYVQDSCKHLRIGSAVKEWRRFSDKFQISPTVSSKVGAVLDSLENGHVIGAGRISKTEIATDGSVLSVLAVLEWQTPQISTGDAHAISNFLRRSGLPKVSLTFRSPVQAEITCVWNLNMTVRNVTVEHEDSHCVCNLRELVDLESERFKNDLWFKQVG